MPVLPEAIVEDAVATDPKVATIAISERRGNVDPLLVLAQMLRGGERRESASVRTE